MKKKRRHQRPTNHHLFSCPRCRACDKFRVTSVKTFSDRVMWLFGYRPILCIRCLGTFYAWPFRIKAEQLQKTKPLRST